MNKSKRGRPVKGDGRRRVLNVRMTDAEYDMLERLSEHTEETKADILRRSLRMYYNLKVHNMII